MVNCARPVIVEPRTLHALHPLRMGVVRDTPYSIMGAHTIVWRGKFGEICPEAI